MLQHRQKSKVLLTLGVLFIGGAITKALSSSPVPLQDGHSLPEIQASAEESSVGAPTHDVSLKEILLTGDMAEALEKDWERLLAKEKALGERELQLEAKRIELKNKAEELLVIQDQVHARWEEMTITAEEDLQHLSKMYATMKPNQAAAIFNKMDPKFAAGFLQMIPSEQAGLILAAMDTEAAYIVSVGLANRNQDIRSTKSPK